MSESAKHILLVDDETDLCEVYSSRFEIEGFRVTVAQRADEALNTAVNDHVDLIVTDIRMPGGSGYDLLTLSKLVDSKIPVILMSGHEQVETMIENGVDQQVYACLAKPFRFEELLKTAKSALQ